MQLLLMHRQDKHANLPTVQAPASPNHQSTAKIERPSRPSVTAGMSETDWNFFIHEWGRYTRQTGITDTVLRDELWSCMETELRQLAFSEGFTANSEAELLTQIKSLAVTILHPSVHVISLHQMSQQESETVKSFSARVKGTATNCNLNKTCTKSGCNQSVPYLEETCYHVVMSGLSDQDLREKVLAQAMLGTVKDLPTLLNYVTAEESARAKSGVHENNQVNGIRRKSDYVRSKTKHCACCGQNLHGDNNKDRPTQCKAYGKECSKCQKMNHFASQCRSTKPVAASAQLAARDSDQQATATSSVNGFLCRMIASARVTSPYSAAPLLQAIQEATLAPVTTLPLPHHIYNTQERKWKQQSPPPAPVLTVSVNLDKAAYGELGLNPPKLVKRAGAGHARARRATTDSGAQLTVINIAELHSLGIKQDSIFSVATNVNTVTSASVDLIGGLFLNFSSSDTNSGTVRRTRQLCYVSKSVPGIYLSEEACKTLGCLPQNFPTVGQCDTNNSASISGVAGITKCTNTGVVGPNDIPCKCPKRSLPPSDIPDLPCAPTVENLPQIKQFILDRFSSSAFNCCEHQPLPLMSDAPPLRLFVDPHATPVAVTSPSVIPHHWVTDVKAGLDRDERLGVIEKVPVNEPVSWCSRMVITPKHDGSPRRVVDHSQVNKHAPRQTHHTKSPHAIATAIPGNKVKTVLDNWHGYHSVPIHPADRHLTTFLTPYGRYRYRTTPQGFISAGDGYTQRMDLIVDDIDDYEHCVDDSILWDDNIEDNFKRVCSFIAKCSKAGCVFNPSKFQFGEREVDFLGFRITDHGIQPHPDFIKSIQEFPRPQSITDVRSWFGLINQISYSFATASTMAPFRHLLSNKIPFYWSAELESAFEASKAEIIKQCEHGVRNFRPNAPTALATDWSKLAMGCWLTQKFCDCPGDPRPGCCPTGWQTIHVNSKFNSPAESRYHPIEGEACASAWGLDKCRMFVLGHPNLILAIDHKPLLAIFGPDQDLSEILNPRLLNFKLKTMAFRFKPIHIPGKAHVVPDAMSRRSDSPIASLPKVSSPPPTVNNVLPAYSDSLAPPDWVSTPSLAAALSPITAQPTADESNQSDELEELLLGQAYASLAGLTPQASADIALFGGHNVEVLTWDRLVDTCKQSTTYQLLHQTVQSGLSESIQDWDMKLQPYFKVRHGLSTLGSVVMLYDRPVIPESLRPEVVEHLHACHGCANGMFQRASSDLYWPGYRQDINAYQAACSTCRRIAPSNPDMPPSTPLDMPEYPFQSICADFFSHAGRTYLIIVDRYSNWLSIQKLTRDNSTNLINTFRDYFTHFGIATILSSDGASIFTSTETMDFFRRWGVKQRISSAYYPRSNKRAEIGVKSAKRLIQDNLRPNGDLDSDKFARALLIHRNTPDPSTNLSPANIVFGRPLRDHIPAPIGHYIPRKEWQELATKREECFLKRHYSKVEDLTRGSKQLLTLIPGDNVYVQDQHGKTPTRWNKSGTILEALPHDSYLVKIDGSGKVTKRNRKFLRKFEPFGPKPYRPLAPPPPAAPWTPAPAAAWTPPPECPPPPPTQAPREESRPAPASEMPLPNLQTQNSSQTSNNTPVHPPPEIPTPLPNSQSQLPKHLRERWIVYPTPIPPQPPASPIVAPLTYYPPSPVHGYPPTPYLSAIPTNATPTCTYLPSPTPAQIAAMPYPAPNWPAQSLYTYGTAWPFFGGGASTAPGL